MRDDFFTVLTGKSHEIFPELFTRNIPMLQVCSEELKGIDLAGYCQNLAL
jgi:hypothetical protein